jgi:hypothetical protein
VPNSKKLLVTGCHAASFSGLLECILQCVPFSPPHPAVLGGSRGSHQLANTVTDGKVALSTPAWPNARKDTPAGRGLSFMFPMWIASDFTVCNIPVCALMQVGVGLRVVCGCSLPRHCLLGQLCPLVGRANWWVPPRNCPSCACSDPPPAYLPCPPFPTPAVLSPWKCFLRPCGCSAVTSVSV